MNGKHIKEWLGVLAKDATRYGKGLEVLGSSTGNSSNSPWVTLKNRNEQLINNPSGPGVRCDWSGSSKLHACQVFPSWGKRLMRLSIEDWPIYWGNPSSFEESPEISFIIAYESEERLPQLMSVIATIAAQQDVRCECLVVDQTPESIISKLPPEIRTLWLDKRDVPEGWYKSWAYNLGAREARGEVLVFHDADILAPVRYGAELKRWLIDDDFETASIQRYLYYLNQASSERLQHTGSTGWSFDRKLSPPETVLQNWLGGTIAIRRESFFEIGGFDEGFVDWGGEDTEFFDRCSSLRQMKYGYLPFVHLWHVPQAGRRDYTNPNTETILPERLSIPVAERRKELRARQFGSTTGPDPAICYKSQLESAQQLTSAVGSHHD